MHFNSLLLAVGYGQMMDFVVIYFNLRKKKESPQSTELQTIENEVERCTVNHEDTGVGILSTETLMTILRLFFIVFYSPFYTRRVVNSILLVKTYSLNNNHIDMTLYS